MCAADVGRSSFLTSCLLALVSAVPECRQLPGGSQTLWRTERGGGGTTHTLTQLEESKAHPFPLSLFCRPPPVPTGAHSPMCALSEMTNLCSQPFKPTNRSEHVHVHHWNPQRASRLKRRAELTVAFALILCSLLEETRQVDHHAITWGKQVRSLGD